MVGVVRKETKNPVINKDQLKNIYFTMFKLTCTIYNFHGGCIAKFYITRVALSMARQTVLFIALLLSLW